MFELINEIQSDSFFLFKCLFVFLCIILFYLLL